MNLAKLFITIAIFFVAQTVGASPVRVNPTGAAKGTINLCAIRDKYGFIWVGTSTGLACFDGNGVPVNNTQAGILRSTTNLRVTNIFEFGDNLLFATPMRLMFYDRKNKTTYRLPVKTKYGVEISSPVNNICQNPAGDELWIATQGQGLFIYNPEKQTLTQHSVQGSFFTDVATGADGMIYAATINGEIHKYKPSGEHVSSHPIPGYASNKAIIHLLPSDNKIWIAGAGEIYRMDIATDDISQMTPVPAMVSSFVEKSPGKLILGTSSGVMEYDTAANALYPIKEAYMGAGSSGSELNVKINHLAADKNGGILAVRSSGEVLEFFFIDNNFRFIPLSAYSEGNRFVHSLTPDNKNNGLWIGSDNGLHYFDIKSGMVKTANIPGIGNQTVNSVTVDSDKVWVGTANNGLLLYNASTGQTRHFRHDEDTPYSLLSDEISNVYVSTAGTTYIFTPWGLCRYNPARNEFNTLPEIGQQTEVVSMAEYYDGTLWAATVNNGLLYLQPGSTRFDYLKSQTLDNVTINGLLMSRNGTLWASSQSDGLFVYNKDSNDFDQFRLPILVNHTILSMQEDNDGTLWVITEESLVRISKDGQVVSNFRHRIPSMVFTRPLALLGNGEMAIGGNNGFEIFNPSQISLHNAPSAYPTTINFPFSDDSGVKNFHDILLYTTDSITLPFDHNSFTIHLAANHSSDMPDVTYDYMLEGFDKDWNTGMVQPEVTYNNLSPGKYRFLVRPSGFSDVETKMLSINILPPWYLSNWAYVGYAILILLIAFLIWLFVRNRVRRHYERRLESLKVQRERESWESKMRFFVDLVHEIRTPLMLISLPMEQLLKRIKALSSDYRKLRDKDFIDGELSHSKKYLGAMQTNLDYLLGITNEILDFRKVENGNVQSLSPEKCNINLLLEDLRDRFEKPMESEGKRLVINLPANPVIAEIDRVKVDRVMMNLLGNARKYCKTVTTVTLSSDDKDAVIIISDDGPGIPEIERNHIFDLYYQIKDDKLATSLGTGLGLAYARLITQAHGGDISIAETEGGGALFTLRLPLKSAVEIPVAGHSRDIYEISGADVRENMPANEDSSEEDEGNEDALEQVAEGNGPLTVLVVDDNTELLEMITDGLDHKYKVITAGDGIEALEKLKENDIDFIVSDVMMPRMNGMELLQKVKGNINYSHIPFIILTAKTTRESREEGMEHGADIYLEKPFSMRSLILQIENIRRTRQYFYARRRGTEPLSLVDAEEKEAIEESKLPQLGKYDREFLDKMETIMAENISDDMFTIDILAERLNMSRSSFYRKIKALMGMTPVDYMKNYRLDVAASQLRDKIRVNEVVANVGFTSNSYFAKCFKEKYGVLPRDYVDSLKES